MSGDVGMVAPSAHPAPLDESIAAAATFKRDGVVKLDDVIDPTLLTECRAQIERDFPDFEAHAGSGSYGLEARRFSIPLPVTGALTDPQVFANPTILKLLKTLLGGGYEMDSFGLLVSLPGAPAQRAHHDALLYPESTLDTLLPPTTVAVSIPLVTMDGVNGTTAFWRRSHRDRARAEGASAEAPDYAPVVPLGSALLWDYRLVHSGCANNSDSPRPVLFAVFCRRWWHEFIPADDEGYERLVIARDALDRVEEKHRKRLVRAKVIDAA